MRSIEKGTWTSRQRWAIALAASLVGATAACSGEEASNPGPTGTTGDGGAGGEVQGGGGAGGTATPLPSGIHALAGLDADLSHDDLAPLGDIVGDAEVVALGESVHTSGGYYQAKHRLFRYLVEEKGFRAYAFESPWTSADGVRDYVASCQGSAFDAVTNGLFGVWASESVLELVEWMCAHNQANPSDPVSFFGFDIQQPWDDAPPLASFVTQVAPAVAAAYGEDLLRCNGATYGTALAYYVDPDADVVDPADHEACLEALAAVEQHFDSNEAAIVAASSAEQLTYARIRLVGLRAWEGQVFNTGVDEHASYEARDAGMAYVLQAMWHLRHPGDKVVVWAHNWHIARAAETTSAEPQGARNMGSHLAESLGTSYEAVGLIGHSVTINWPGVHIGPTAKPSSKHDVELQLHELDHPYLLVDLAFPGTDEPFLDAGADYRVNSWKMVPAEQFRALVFLDESPGMDALLW